MLFKKIEKNLQEIIDLKNKPKIILGLSGGPDSVFLFYFLKELHDKKQIELIAAHLDHGWRKESAQDEKFCKSLCEKYKIPLVSTHAKNLRLDFKFSGSKEELGRKLRRHFFEKVLKENNANYIALAHHLQDQEETFFWRILRGTTLTGLTSMRPLKQGYLRPMLNINKQDILYFLHANKISYLKDLTNETEDFLRNRVRKYVLPAMQKCDKRFDQKFASTLKHLQQEEEFLKELTKQSFEAIFKLNKAKESFIGAQDKFLKLNKVLQKRVLIYWLIQENVKFSLSYSYLKEILKFINSPKGGTHKLSTSWNLHKKKNVFYIDKI